jgi:hypothetical protein
MGWSDNHPPLKAIYSERTDGGEGDYVETFQVFISRTGVIWGGCDFGVYRWDVPIPNSEMAWVIAYGFAQWFEKKWGEEVITDDMQSGFIPRNLGGVEIEGWSM